jgi:hypothetical protein
MNRQCPECLLYSNPAAGNVPENHLKTCSHGRSKEVYKSTTHGPIPLSFNGRMLIQNLRFAITKAIARGDWHDPREEVSFARGELAHYISALENAAPIGVVGVPLLSIEERLARIEKKLRI